MPVPSVLFLISFAAALFGFGLTGSVESAPVLLALLSALAALILLVRAPKRRSRKSRAPKRRVAAGPRRSIVVDGSNIMHWKDETPRLDTLREVVHHRTCG